MVMEQSIRRIVNLEFLKLSIVAFAIISGGIVFAIFVPLRDFLLWRDFFFYVSIGGLIIIYFILSFTFKRKKLNYIHSEKNKLAIVPSTSSVAKKSKMSSFNYPIKSPKASKYALKIDENAITYCPKCGRSFTKNHNFCPACGFCGIQKVP